MTGDRAGVEPVRITPARFAYLDKEFQMTIEEVRDVIDLQHILAGTGLDTSAEVLTDLINWKREGQVDINLTIGSNGPEATITPKSKRGKATEAGPEYGPDDEPGF